MKSRYCMVTATMALSLLTVCLVAARGRPNAPGTTDFRPGIQKLGDEIEKKDSAQIKQLAQQLAVSGGLEGFMTTQERRDPAGKKLVFGVGKAPGVINPDGIEAMIQNLSKRPRPQEILDREA